MSDQRGEEATSSEGNAPGQSLPESIKIIRTLLDPAQRWTTIGQGMKTLLAAAAVSVVLVLPLMVGQIWAMGIRAAILQNGWSWLRAPLIGPGLLIGFTFIIYPIELVFWGLARGTKTGLRLVSRRFGDKIYKTLGAVLKAGFALAVAGAVVYQCGKEGYEDGLKQISHRIRDADQKTIAETQDATAKQQAALKKFSDTAQTLLKDMDKTALKVAEAKREITETMAIFDGQLEATQAAQTNLAKLAEQQRAIQSRAEELDRILQGKRPITQEDMDRSARDNLWQGLLMGILTSLIATFIYPRLGRLGTSFLRKKTSAE